MHIKNKAAITWRLAFSITFLSLFVACEDPGSVGGGFVEKSEVNIDTILVTNLVTQNQDAYLGRLSRSATGRFEDNLFGNIEAVSLFKPSIQRSSDTLVFDNNTEFKLNLQIIEGEVFGDTTSTGTYSIYRVTSPWRGSSFRNSMDISINEAEVIGQFSDADVDTNGYVLVDLNSTWKDDYVTFFNMPTETRDDAYKVGDYGLAIVPDLSNSKVVYANYGLSNIVANGADTTIHFILDWAVDLERSGEVVNLENTILQSTFDNVFQLNIAELADQLDNKNFVRAELVFKADTASLNQTLDLNEVRSPVLGLGLTVGPVDDIAFEIGFGNIDIAASLINGSYRYNLTSLLNNYLYGGLSISDSYLYLSATEGVLGYTSLFSENSVPEDAPKLIIYGLEDGE